MSNVFKVEPGDSGALLAYIDRVMGDSAVEHIALNRVHGTRSVGKQVCKYDQAKMLAIGGPEEVLENIVRYHIKAAGKWKLTGYDPNNATNKPRMEFQVEAETRGDGQGGGQDMGLAIRDLSNAMSGGQDRMTTMIEKANERSEANRERGEDRMMKFFEMMQTQGSANLEHRTQLDAAAAEIAFERLAAERQIGMLEFQLASRDNGNSDQMKMMMFMCLMNIGAPALQGASSAIQLHTLKKAGILEDMDKKEILALMKPPPPAMDPMMMMMMMGGDKDEMAKMMAMKGLGAPDGANGGANGNGRTQFNPSSPEGRAQLDQVMAMVAQSQRDTAAGANGSAKAAAPGAGDSAEPATTRKKKTVTGTTPAPSGEEA